MGALMIRRLGMFAGALLALAAPLPALATEGALGRVVQGSNVQADAGIVPNVPILAVNVSNIYFDGSIGASHPVPIDGELALNLHAQLSFTPVTLLKVWNTGPGRWNFASAVTVPIIWNEATATLSTDNISRQVQQSSAGVSDILLTPIIAGYHFSKTAHVALSFGVWAPVGSYSSDRLANDGLNYWTFVPAIAYTQIVPRYGLDFTGQVALQINTANPDTNYRSAPLLTVDGLATKKLGGGFALGLGFGWVEQIGNDSGALADKLGGFQGASVALGPIVTYNTLVGGKLPVSATLRWTPTVESRNRLSGDTVMFTLSSALPL
jgi:hypothetical protein